VSSVTLSTKGQTTFSIIIGTFLSDNPYQLIRYKTNSVNYQSHIVLIACPTPRLCYVM